jgi:hypothetical protein
MRSSSLMRTHIASGSERESKMVRIWLKIQGFRRLISVQGCSNLMVIYIVVGYSIAPFSKLTGKFCCGARLTHVRMVNCLYIDILTTASHDYVSLRFGVMSSGDPTGGAKESDMTFLLRHAD